MEKKCQYCNEPLDSKRVDAKRHTNCRYKVYRENKYKKRLQEIKDLYNIK